jgi:nucleoside-diphosphate-sugar epimerase
MRVLVTGHHGYIGSVMTRTLADAGHGVVGLDSFLYEGCDFGPDRDAVASLRTDVRDVGTAELEGFDAVVHLAGLSNDPLGALDVELTEEVNYRATMRLARAAKDAGVARFLFSSSCSMYGLGDGDRPVDEEAALRPLTAYATSKARAEEGLLGLGGDGFSSVLMRNATVYGVSPRLRLDLVLNNLVGWAVTTGKVRILSDGTPWRPLLHVEDAAVAAVALLEAPQEHVHCEAFNIGRDDENYQVRDLAEIARDAVGDCVIEYAGNADPDSRSYRVDFGKLARTVPEARLSWTAEAGARQLAAAYRAEEMTLEEFESSRYTRLKRLEESMDAGILDRALRRTVTV